MIKKAKLSLFSIIAIVASLLVTSNVFAFSEGEYIGGDYHEDYQYVMEDAIYKYGGMHTYYMFNHYTKYNGTEYPMFCLDPARKSGGTNANLVVSRVLDQNDPVDAVLLAIMSDPDYIQAEKSLAIRAFVPFTQDFSTYAPIISYEHDAAVSNANTGILWASKDPDKSIQYVLGLSDSTVKTLADFATVYNDGYDSEFVLLAEGNYYVDQARTLFYKALKVGAEVAKGKKTYKKYVTYTTPEFTDSYKLVEEDGKRKGIRELRFDATFTKFNDGSTDPVTVNINPDTNGVAVATKYEYKVAGTDEWKEFNKDTDFRSLLDKDSVVINFKVTAKAAVQTKSKFNINFKVDVTYQDEDILVGAFLYNTNDSGLTQRFYIYDEEPGKHSPYEKTVPWDDVVGYCTNIDESIKNDTDKFKTYINECCRAHNDAQFNIIDECEKEIKKGLPENEREYCKLKASFCDYCNSKVTVPQTCSEFSEGEFEKGKTAVISGPEDIKVCVMDGEDESKNSYRLTKEVTLDNGSSYTFAGETPNRYCSVSCKEDYSFDLPTGRYVSSGRYFELAMGVKATKSCYTDLINYDLFEKDIQDYGNIINSYIAAGTASASNTEFKNAYDQYNKAIRDIQACSVGWNAEYDVDPLITFDYDEEYIRNTLKTDLKFVPAGDKKTSQSKWFCNGSDVDRQYNNCIGATATSTAQTKTIDVVECNTSNAISYSCKTVQKQIPTTKFAKVTTTYEETYAPQTVFYTEYSTGVIEVNKDGNKKYTKLDSYLDSKIDESIKFRSGSLPVSLKDSKGVYNYNIKFNNVGEYFDKDDKGRLIGGKTAVALTNQDTTFKGTYVCAYVVNCPECNITCEEKPELGIFCNLDTKDEDIECVGSCAYDAEFGELYSVHTTSLEVFNPNGRTLGANLTTQKGEALIDSITSQGESIYKDPEYSFVFTPAAISFLRHDINANSQNGYLGEASAYDMNCYLYSDLITDPKEKASIIGTNKDYTICQSSVLDALEKDYDAVRVHTLADSRAKIQSWLDSDYCKDSKNICALVGNIGPAWK